MYKCSINLSQWMTLIDVSSGSWVIWGTGLCPTLVRHMGASLCSLCSSPSREVPGPRGKVTLFALKSSTTNKKCVLANHIFYPLVVFFFVRWKRYLLLIFQPTWSITVKMFWKTIKQYFSNHLWWGTSFFFLVFNF